jgi:hypothetical protein
MPAPRALRAYTIFSALALLAACGGEGGIAGAAKAVPAAGQGGTAIVGILGNVQSFNPVTNTASTVQDIERYMLFTPLIQFDEKLQPRAYLAESWTMDGDTGVTMKLRQDVKWHDGKPVTAEDVKFTFDLAKNPKATSGLVGSVYLTQVKSATVVDPYTIRFAFTRRTRWRWRTSGGRRFPSTSWGTCRRSSSPSTRTTRSRSAAAPSRSASSGPTRAWCWRRTPPSPRDRRAAEAGPRRLPMIPEATTLVTSCSTARRT